MSKATKKLQILRNAANETANNLEAAKTALKGQLPSRADGEIIACRYKDGDKVKAIIGIVNKANAGNNGNVDSLTFFEGLNVDTTGVELPASVQVAINGINDKINTINGADTVEGSTAKKIKDAIEALDVNDAETEGEFVTAVSETDGKVSVSRKPVAADKVTANAIAANGLEGGKNVAVEGDNVKAQIESLAKTIAAKDEAQANAIANLDKADAAVAKQFVKKVSETDGIINVERGSIVSTDKTVKIGDSTDGGVNLEVNIDGTTITKSAETGVLSVASSALTQYVGKEAVKVSAVDGENNKTVSLKIAEADKVLSQSDNGILATLGLSYDSEGKKIKLTGKGANNVIAEIDTSDFVVDGMLQSVAYSTEPDKENILVFTFNGDAGNTAIEVDLAKYIDVYTAGNGVNIADHAISVKLDTANENAFLTVGADGLKLSGVQNAINEKVASLDATVDSTGGALVSVKVVETDGKVETVTVNDVNVASKTEVSNAANASKTEVAQGTGIAVSHDNTAADGHTKTTVSLSEETTNRLGYADIALQTVSVTSADTELLTASVAEKAGDDGAKTQAISLTPIEVAMGSTNELGKAAVTSNGLVDGNTLAAVLNSIDTIDAGTY